MSSTGTDPVQLDRSISLTNFVELIAVDNLCNSGQNQFAIYRYQDDTPTLQKLFAAIDVYYSDYVLYLAVPDTRLARFALSTANFTDIPGRDTIYFALSNDIACEDLETRLYNIWTQRTRGVRLSTQAFPVAPTQFPIQLPSRGKVFRDG